MDRVLVAMEIDLQTNLHFTQKRGVMVQCLLKPGSLLPDFVGACFLLRCQCKYNERS